MDETKDNELIFQEMLDIQVNNYGTGSQEGVKASLIDCQNIFNCVSVNNQREIAKKFQVDERVIKTMIKFMPSIKESIVEFEVVCCTGSRCAKNGSMEVIKAVKETLGIGINETTKDGKIRLTTRKCFKKCGLGPNIMVNGEFYHKMDKLRSVELMTSIANNKKVD